MSEKNTKRWIFDLKATIQVIVILGALVAHYHFSTIKIAVKLENHELRITQNEKDIGTIQRN